MKKLAIALLAVAMPAFSQQLVFKGENVTVRLLEAPCPKPVVDLIQEQHQAKFRQAEVVFQGKGYRACWTLVNWNVIVIDETGDAGEIPAAAFKEEEV